MISKFVFDRYATQYMCCFLSLSINILILVLGGGFCFFRNNYKADYFIYIKSLTNTLHLLPINHKNKSSYQTPNHIPVIYPNPRHTAVHLWPHWRPPCHFSYCVHVNVVTSRCQIIDMLMWMWMVHIIVKFWKFSIS
jgi:hypothetical protein